MITKEQALELVAREIPGDSAIIEDATEDHDEVFAVYYQGKKYLKTNNPEDMIDGHGPVLVDKRNGTLHYTGSAYDTSYYVWALRATGSVDSELLSTIKITKIPADYDAQKLTFLLEQTTPYNRINSRVMAEKLFRNESEILDAGVSWKVGKLFKTLEEKGFGCEYMWQTFDDIDFDEGGVVIDLDEGEEVFQVDENGNLTFSEAVHKAALSAGLPEEETEKELMGKEYLDSIGVTEKESGEYEDAVSQWVNETIPKN